MAASRHLSVLNTIDDTYRQCWDILCELKGNPTSRLRTFQPLLCDAMLKLSKEFRRINHKQDELAKRSARLSPTWTEARQTHLTEAKHSLRRAKAIGQSLGNAFAWFFYQHEPVLLKLHGQHQLADSLHADIGGAGEHAILSAVPMIDGAMVLHHGITTILRIGDISLIDLKSFRVRGIGEIKTSQVSKNELRVTVACIADEPFSSFSESEKREHRVPAKTPRGQKKKLKKQTERMVATLKSRQDKAPAHDMTLDEDRHLKSFSTALKSAKVGRYSFYPIADGLMLVAYRQRRCSLARALSRKTPSDLTSRIEGEPDLTQIALPGSADNALVISNFAYGETGHPIHLLGTMPLFWWGLDLELIRQVLFQEMVVVTLFNPAHLISKLQQKGFDVSMSSEDGRLRVSRTYGGGRVTVEGMEYFKNLITHGLYSEEIVVEMIDSVASQTGRQGAEQHEPGRTDITFNHALWEPRPRTH